jgi:CII-binding regulator of phage lambda lysogenization HflD
MNKARGEFYKLKRECDIYHEGMMPEIINYVTKLELKLNESEQAEKDLSALLIECKHKIEELEQQRVDLIEYLTDLYTGQIVKSQRLTDILNKYKNVK